MALTWLGLKPVLCITSIEVPGVLPTLAPVHISHTRHTMICDHSLLVHCAEPLLAAGCALGRVGLSGHRHTARHIG